MSYGITPIAVKLPNATAVIRSKDKRLLKALMEEFEDRFSDVDEISEDDDEPLPMFEAL
jgi:hypothetical protein